MFMVRSMNCLTPLPDAAGHSLEGGAVSAAEAARAERRAWRLGVLDRVCALNLRAAERLSEHIAGELPESESQVFARVSDPCLTLTRLTRAIRQTVALAEKIDEDDETRQARLKAEREARDRREAAEAAAIQAEQARREAGILAAPLENKKRRIRHAVRNAHRDADPDLEFDEREGLLDDLFEEYEAYDDYSGDEAKIVAQLCADLKLFPLPSDDDEAEDGGDDAEPGSGDDAWDSLVAMAGRYLKALDPADAQAAKAPSLPAVQAQGPPEDSSTASLKHSAQPATRRLPVTPRDVRSGHANQPSPLLRSSRY